MKDIAMIKPFFGTLALAMLTAALPIAAFAHTGHAGGTPFSTGFLHPLGGSDHVLAMVAVGLWAAITGGWAVWLMPLSFVLAMVSGAALGFGGVPLPGVEPMIIASVMALGAAAALALRPALPLALAAIGLFGVAHGYAHMAEGPGTGMTQFAAGFLIATCALHGLGLAIGGGLVRMGQRSVVRLLGGGAAFAGLALAVV